MSLLEDPNKSTIGGADGEEVHDHCLERQEDRPQEQKEHQVGGQDHEGDRPWRRLSDGIREVEVEGCPSTDEHLALYVRVFPADLTHEGVRLLGVVAHRRVRGQDRDVVSCRTPQSLPNLRRQVLLRCRKKLLVLLAGEARVEIYHALHPFDARLVL